MFKAIWKELTDSLKENLNGILLVGEDGIEIDSHVTSQDLPSDVLAAEMSTLMQNARKMASEMSLGELSEVWIYSNKYRCALFRVNSEAYLLLAGTPEINTGMVRFAAQRSLPKIAEVLL